MEIEFRTIGDNGDDINSMRRTCKALSKAVGDIVEEEWKSSQGDDPRVVLMRCLSCLLTVVCDVYEDVCRLNGQISPREKLFRELVDVINQDQKGYADKYRSR